MRKDKPNISVIDSDLKDNVAITELDKEFRWKIQLKAFQPISFQITACNANNNDPQKGHAGELKIYIYLRIGHWPSQSEVQTSMTALYRGKNILILDDDPVTTLTK